MAELTLAHTSLLEPGTLTAIHAMVEDVEGVAVARDQRRRGIANALMEAVEGVIRDAYEVGALSATDMAAPLYATRGWRVWEGPLSVLAPEGPRPTPEDAGGVYVLDPSGLLDPAGALACDWRDGEVW